MQELDQKSAIMIVIEHLGNIPAGTKCSAVFFDTDKLQREQEFHAKLYSQNGVDDPEVVRTMVAKNVPTEPYWLVSLKTMDAHQGGELAQFHRVDARTGKVLPYPQ
ncbi:MAG: hypothetical protein AAGG44_06525 [Planctomycetota bacterium]